MFWNAHLSARTLLLLAEGELPAGQLARALRHVATCAACEGRLREAAGRVAEAIRTYDEQTSAPLPSAAPARARLAQTLAALRAEGEEDSTPVRSPGLAVRFTMAAACAAAGFLAFAWFNPSGPGFTGGTDGIFLLPRGDLTPGVARDVALGDICGGDPRVALRPIPADVHRSVFDAYGADYGRADDYELDQLITPELGGTQDPANLWPQTYTSTQWNAWVKDELERLLHQRVCEGSMTLAAAQQEMASDWIAAYKRHLDTDTPLRDYLKYPPTEHDRELLLSELAERGVTAPRDTASILTAARRAGVRFVAFTPDR